MFDNIASDYDNAVKLLEYKMSGLNNAISIIDASGANVNRAYYDAMRSVNALELNDFTNEITALENKLKDGTITRYSDEWYAALDSLQSVYDKQAEAKKKEYEYALKIEELTQKMYKAIGEVYSRVNKETDFIIGLMSHFKSTDDKTGYYTDNGIGKLVGYSNDLRNAKEKTRSDKEYLDSLIAIRNRGADENGMYGNFPSLEAINSAINEWQDEGQTNIGNVYSIMESIYSLEEERYRSELNYLKDLIDNQKEELNAEKDLHNYAKQIAEKNNNINTLQKQIAAYSGDSSEEAMAKLQQLNKSLADAQEDLRETEYDKFISDQEDLLDSLYTQYEELITSELEDFIGTVERGLGIASENIEAGNDTLQSIADLFGYDKQYGVDINETKKLVEQIKDRSGTIADAIAASNAQQNSASKAAEQQPTTASSGGGGGVVETSTSPTFAVALKTMINGQTYESIYDYINKNAKNLASGKYTDNAVNKLIARNFGGKHFSDAMLANLAKKFKITDKDYSKKGNLYNILKEYGFAQGGIGKAIKLSGEDGIAFVRNGEGFVAPEDVKAIKLLLDTVPVMNDVMDSLSTLPNITDIPTVSTNVGDVSFNFSLPNVTDSQNFVNEIQNNRKLQQAIQSVTLGVATGRGRLSVNSIR